MFIFRQKLNYTEKLIPFYLTMKNSQYAVLPQKKTPKKLKKTNRYNIVS